MPSVLAITSHVVYGHVGGRASVPLLQALGIEAWHLPTVLFSNHPARGGQVGEAVSASLVASLLAALEAREFRPDAVLSGYLGTVPAGEATADYLERSGADLPYCCDPVMGDDGRLYVADGLLEVFRDRLLPRADIATPNRFELELLVDRTLPDIDSVLEAAGELRRAGSGIVVCTSARVEERVITTLAVAPGGVYAVCAPRFADPPHGTGDLFAAALFARYLAGGELETALGEAAGIVDLVLRRGGPGAPELALVESLPDLISAVPSLPVRRML